MIGKIGFWSNLKGYGFIVGPEQDDDLFCHHSALLEGRCIEKDALVSYEIGEHRGNRCAKNVRRIVVSTDGVAALAPEAGSVPNGRN